jgi:hypothetical protein
MSGGMAFRKDCDDCGHSFLSPDRKSKLCPRCAGKVRQRSQQETTGREGLPLQPSVKTGRFVEKHPPSGPADDLKPSVSEGIATKIIQDEAPKRTVQKEPAEKQKANETITPSIPDKADEEIELTEAQEQEIVERYQAYVNVLGRPMNGRRRTIALEMGLPYRTVVLALRQWNQRQAQIKELTREERFLVEKAYFDCLERKRSYSAVKEQIIQETGLNSWEVSRYLDILHDGEDKLRNVPDVSLEQETAILTEYQIYLSETGPPSSFLHPLIAERTGGTPKQVYKVLLSYRLSRFRERWG